MKFTKFWLMLLSFYLLFSASFVFAQTNKPQIIINPEYPIQGEPVEISLPNTTVKDTARIYFDDKSLWFFNYNGRPTALFGLDLNIKIGKHKITVLMEDGQSISKQINIQAREKYEAPLGIPDKLGGNTPQAQTNLVNSLSKENEIINNVYSAPHKYWYSTFRYPLDTKTVTDEYGYLRQTGYYSIAHKGTDFKANTGTSVYAINGGIVRLARYSSVYGNMVAIDHGLGLISFYMHLSKLKVKSGDYITKGQLIGLSGDTGYALSPHLHLSIKIYGISIDPAKFLEMFN